MKRLFCLLMLCSILVSFDKSASKVLIVVRDGSGQLEYMLTNEVVKMQEIIRQSGFEPIIATASGEMLNAGAVALKPNLKISDVKVDDYAGFMVPCLTVDNAPEDVIALVKSAAEKNKPVAAQAGGVVVLAKAGLLDGKKYTLNMDGSGSPDFINAIYSGTGVIRDGNIITSGICPWLSKETGKPDGTTGVTQMLVEAMKASVGR